MKRWTPSLVLLAVLSAGPPALAQRGEGRPPAREESPEQREQMQQRLESQLQEVRQQQERLERALSLLREGAPLPRVEMASRTEPRRRDPAQVREDRERVFAFLREHMPDILERIEQREHGRGIIDRASGHLVARLEEINEERESDPKSADLKLADFKAGLRTLAAIDDLRRAAMARDEDPASFRRAAAAVRESVAAHFDVQSRLQRHEIQSLQERVDRLVGEFQQRQSERDSQIEEKFQEILRGVEAWKARVERFQQRRREGRDEPRDPSD
jgi:hypothetical protein